ncbi:MAG: hypothetical protein HQL40_20685 [Alphaproteobacteria bacterium]|nr:hypothetical protein [Alphaproteobacteria bacterium]
MNGLYPESTITCPSCGRRTTETMPDGRLASWRCPVCATLVTAGEVCCVFCAHGDVPCPPSQRAMRSCCGGD